MLDNCMLHLPYSELPVRDPGAAPTSSPPRYLAWIGRRQGGILAANAIFGIGWMVTQALVWAAVGSAIDRGIAHHSSHELLVWVGIVLGLGVAQAIFGSLRHQLAVTNWMHAAFRTAQVVGRHVTRETTALTDEVPPGDIVNTVMADAMRVGGAYDAFARFVGSIVAWLTVSIILLRTSVQLGLIVMIGVPALMCLTIPLMRPLHRAQANQREASGRLAAQASDTVIGLRILRGVGGEEVFLSNYQRQNDLVRRSGFRIATPSAALDSGQIFLPAILTVIVTYIGAIDVQHHTLQAGQLVSFFGYTTFLTTPLRTAIEYIMQVTRAYVGGAKVLRILRVNSPVVDAASSVAWPSAFAEIRDERSGVVLRRGEVTGFVSPQSADLVDVVDRLGRFRADTEGVFVDDVAIGALTVADVRAHIVVSEIEPRLFSGPLRDELSPRDNVTDEELLAALTSASATDMLVQLERGLDTIVEERGRSFSGGQRQRLSFARALLTNADVLIMMEPTSAVDTHTEHRIASRLREARNGRTTVITTSSPLMLEATDRVFLIVDGVAVAEGTHADLVATNSDYQRIVLRSDES